MHYDSARTLCPFYIAETAKKVSCEGVGCNRLTLVFDSVTAKAAHKRHLCDRNYKTCEIYKLINDKHNKKEGRYGTTDKN